MDKIESSAAERPAQVIRREGEYWTIEFDGAVCRLRDARGLHHLAYLLHHPGEEVPALALEQNDRRRPPPVAASGPVDGHDARERARVNVTRAISSILRRIADHHQALGEHLNATIRTGAFCSYRPDPRLPRTWTG